MVARRACCLLVESAFWHDAPMHLDEEHTLSSLLTILSRIAFGLGAPVGLRTRRGCEWFRAETSSRAESGTRGEVLPLVSALSSLR